MVPHRHLQTDGQTTCHGKWQYRALRSVASRCKNCMS